MSDSPIRDLETHLHQLNATDDEDQMIIGLDFGTTFSGIAYCFTGSEKVEPISILDWPGNKGANAPKVPTVLSYSDINGKSGKSGKNGNNMTWGYELDQTTSEKIEAIKLLLDPDQPKPLYVPSSRTKAELKKLGKPAVEVASDYLKALYSHALTNIEASWPQEYLEMLEKRFVLTVPAVWSDRAKAATEEAARKAGISPVVTIKEPEAAALYTLHYLKEKALKVGDAFVLCDAGGGTVDLISYEITKLVPLELKELVPGKGGLAGSLMLNRRFEQLIKDIVGEERFVTLRTHKGFRLAMKQFDQSIKTAYMGKEDEEYFVNFPQANLEDIPEMGLSSNCLTLTGEMIKEIFDPLVNDIAGLVNEQVTQVRLKRMSNGDQKADEIKAIFLVGGFGSSRYLRQHLQEAYPEIQVIQPHDAWSAIVKGAVMSQLPLKAVITSTVATKHYGVEANSEYSESEDLGQPKTWDRYEEVWLVPKMTWYIRTGDDLLRNSKTTFPFYQKLPENFKDNDLIIHTTLVESHAVNPPKHPRKGLIRKNVTLRSDLRSIDRSRLTKKQTGKGETYFEVHYSIALSSQTASMVFSLEYEGEEMGSVEASYS